MSWVLYETSTSIVRGHFSQDPGTPPAGQSKIERVTPPLFVPPFTTHEWVYDSSLDDFSLIGPFFIPDVTLRTHTGAMINMRGDGTEYGVWGDSASNAGVTMFRDGELVGFSVTLDEARTSGIAEFRITIDGVEQNSSDNTFLIDGTNSINNSKEFSSPILFSKGQIISIVSKNTSFSPTSADATVSFWYRDQELVT